MLRRWPPYPGLRILRPHIEWLGIYPSWQGLLTQLVLLLLFAFAAPAITFFVTPLASLWSRRHEFEADDFASRHASAAELASALVKLHRDNASTLTPDALYAAFYYSHPPPLVRITRLRA